MNNLCLTYLMVHLTVKEVFKNRPLKRKTQPVNNLYQLQNKIQKI